MSLSKKLTVERKRESSLGFHFFNLYQCCPRKFYIKYHLRIVPKGTSLPLVLGSCFHEGKAAFYLRRTEKAALEASSQMLELSKDELLSEEAKEEISFRLPLMLRSWISSFGRSDLKQYSILRVESQLSVPILDTGLEMTIRADAVLQDRLSKAIFIFETKTSGFSHRLTSEAVFYGDQATSYIWGVRKVLGLDVFGCVPDICYWNRNSRNVSNLQNLRGDVVVRTPYALESFEKGIAQILSEINQKSSALSEGYDPWTLFPRNSFYCLSYGHPCEYSGICYERLEGLKRLPSEFKRDRRRRTLVSRIEDQVAIQ